MAIVFGSSEAKEIAQQINAGKFYGDPDEGQGRQIMSVTHFVGEGGEVVSVQVKILGADDGATGDEDEDEDDDGYVAKPSITYILGENGEVDSIKLVLTDRDNVEA
jgi:hypothetical protein